MKRELTKSEKEECAALKSIFLLRKRDAGLTQESAADFLGYKTQGAVSQYLNGKVALNLQAAIGFSRLLDCKVRDFCPRLSSIIEHETAISAEASDEPILSNPNLLALSQLRGRATPRSIAALDKIEQAAKQGRLKEADLILLEGIAARFEELNTQKS
ncbi:MAG: helix-turn-helix domain-containing protein [Pseudomonadota bacterium]